MWSPGIFKILLLCVLLTLKLQIDIGYTYIAEKPLPSVIGLTDFLWDISIIREFYIRFIKP